MVLQSYESEVGNEYVIRGNSAMLKCGIPSYVADLVHVSAWLDDHGQSYHPTDSLTGKNTRLSLWSAHFWRGKFLQILDDNRPVKNVELIKIRP